MDELLRFWYWIGSDLIAEILVSIAAIQALRWVQSRLTIIKKSLKPLLPIFGATFLEKLFFDQDVFGSVVSPH
jgi:hypothetical protein